MNDAYNHGTDPVRAVLKTVSIWVMLCAPSIILATPPSNTGVHFVNYTLTIDPDATDRIQIRLPEALEDEEDAPMSHGTRSPSVFLFEDNSFDPGGNTGWHYHPGMLLETVVAGSIDWYDANCQKHIRKAGDFFVENGWEIHEVRNSGSVPARFLITFIIAKGLNFKVSSPAPSCAAALGLN
jgi:quercetin dioxygenase-like cupin family protein